MIWTTNTHSFSATLCQKTGKPCPVARQMMLNLARAMNKAEGVTAADFELTGTIRLQGCAAGCEARYVADHARISLFCDIARDASQSQLDRFADAMFSVESTGLVPATGRTCPSAMIQANRLVRNPRQVTETPALP